jgi:hypothetical protein
VVRLVGCVWRESVAMEGPARGVMHTGPWSPLIPHAQFPGHSMCRLPSSASCQGQHSLWWLPDAAEGSWGLRWAIGRADSRCPVPNPTAFPGIQGQGPAAGGAEAADVTLPRGGPGQAGDAVLAHTPGTGGCRTKSLCHANTGNVCIGMYQPGIRRSE